MEKLLLALSVLVLVAVSTPRDEDYIPTEKTYWRVPDKIVL